MPEQIWSGNDQFWLLFILASMQQNVKKLKCYTFGNFWYQLCWQCPEIFTQQVFSYGKMEQKAEDGLFLALRHLHLSPNPYMEQESIHANYQSKRGGHVQSRNSWALGPLNHFGNELKSLGESTSERRLWQAGGDAIEDFLAQPRLGCTASKYRFVLSSAGRPTERFLLITFFQ